MNIEEFVAYDPDDTLFPSDMWAELFDDTIAEDADAVHMLAQMMLGVKQAIESGPQGIQQAVNTLMDMIHELFPYTETFKRARNLWILSLEGRLTAHNDPEKIINAALERGLKETMTARARASTPPGRSIATTSTNRKRKAVNTAHANKQV